jgi:AraC-like DNA-binding protein
MPYQEQPAFVSKQTSKAQRFYSNLKPDLRKPLTIVSGGVETMLPDYIVDRQSFPWYAVEWVVEGKGFVRIGRTVSELGPGSVFSYGPGVPHRIEYEGPGTMRKYFLDVAGSSAKEQLEKAGLLTEKVLTATRTDEMNDLWRWIELEALESGTGDSVLCGEVFAVLCSKIRQRTSGKRSPRTAAEDAYRLVRQFIEKHFLEFTTIQDVGDALGMSPAYISRLFKNSKAGGAYRSLLRHRMTHAANRLCDEAVPIREVAEELGYTNAFQFSRAFKSVMGISPSQMRHLRRGRNEQV